MKAHMLYAHSMYYSMEIYAIIVQTRLRHKYESVIWQSVLRMNYRDPKNADDWGVYCVLHENISQANYTMLRNVRSIIRRNPRELIKREGSMNAQKDDWGSFRFVINPSRKSLHFTRSHVAFAQHSPFSYPQKKIHNF